MSRAEKLIAIGIMYASGLKPTVIGKRLNVTLPTVRIYVQVSMMPKFVQRAFTDGFLTYEKANRLYKAFCKDRPAYNALVLEFELKRTK